MNNKTIIITFAHCKGGVGKSTLCCHLTTLFKINNPSLKIGLLDLDDIQYTSYNFFINRKINDSLYFLGKAKSVEDIDNIMQKEFLDVLFVDTAGGSCAMTDYVIKNTNILITPIQYSVVDIKSFIDLDNGKIIDGPFKRIVNRNINRNFKWILINNKLPLMNRDSTYDTLFEEIALRVGAKLFYIYDRHEYRKSFEDSQLTPNELLQYRSDFTRSQKAAADDINIIYAYMISIVKNMIQFQI